MKLLLFALPTVLSLLLFSRSIGARKEPAAAEYWKMVMKDDPMPQAISNLIVQSREESLVDEESRSRFVRDFNVRPSVIIYHSHVNLKKHETGSSMLPRIDHEVNGLKAPGHGDEESLT